MTVKELKENLEQFDEETEVKFAYNYGDHCRTTVCEDIRRVDQLPVKFSGYHSMDMLADEDDKNYDELKQLVILY